MAQLAERRSLWLQRRRSIESLQLRLAAAHAADTLRSVYLVFRQSPSSRPPVEWWNERWRRRHERVLVRNGSIKRPCLPARRSGWRKNLPVSGVTFNYWPRWRSLARSLGRESAAVATAPTAVGLWLLEAGTTNERANE